MAGDESKVLVKLRLLGASLMARDAKRAAGGLKEVGRAGRGANKGLSQIKGGRVQSALGLVQRGGNVAQRALGGVGRVSGVVVAQLGRVTRAAKIAGLALAGGIAAGGALVARNGVKLNAQFQDLTASFTTLLGTEGKARAFVESMRDVTSISPLRLTEALDAARGLIGAGMRTDKVRETTRALQNMALIAGGDVTEKFQRVSKAVEAIQARGKLTAREVNRLADAGVPIRRILAKELGLTGEQLANVGEEGISGQRAIDALIRSFTTGRMAKAAEHAQNTWSVQVARLRKNFEQIQRLAVAPLFKLLNDRVMPKVLELSQSAIRLLTDEDLTVAEKIEKVLDRIGEKGRVGSVVAGAVRGAADFVSGVRGREPASPQQQRQITAGVVDIPEMSAAQQAGEKIRGIIGDVVAWGRNTLPKVGETIRGVATDVIDTFRPALPFVQNVLLPLLQGIGEGVMSGVVLAFKVAVPIVKAVAEVLGFVGRAAEPFQGVIRNIGRVIGVVFAGPILKGIGVLSTMGRQVPTVVRAVGVAARVLAVPIRIVVSVVKSLGGVFKVIGTVLRAFGSGLQFVNRWLAFSTSSFGRVVFAVTNFVSGVIGRLAQLPGQAVAKIRDFIGQIAGGLRGSVGRIVSAAGSIGRGIIRGISDAIGKGKELLGNALRTAIDKLPLPGFIKGRLKKVLGFHAHGGRVRTPLQVVGEHGPELAALPAGSRVVTASETRRALREQRPQVTVLAEPRFGPLFANLVVNLDGREIHRGVYRVERSLAEAR